MVCYSAWTDNEYLRWSLSDHDTETTNKKNKFTLHSNVTANKQATKISTLYAYSLAHKIRGTGVLSRFARVKTHYLNVAINSYREHIENKVDTFIRHKDRQTTKQTDS